MYANLVNWSDAFVQHIMEVLEAGGFIKGTDEIPFCSDNVMDANGQYISVEWATRMVWTPLVNSLLFKLVTWAGT